MKNLDLVEVVTEDHDMHMIFDRERALGKILIGEAAEPAAHLESDMPRYVQASTYADGTPYFRYNPPQEFVDAGVVRRGVLNGDRLQAFQLA